MGWNKGLQKDGKHKLSYTYFSLCSFHQHRADDGEDVDREEGASLTVASCIFTSQFSPLANDI